MQPMCALCIAGLRGKRVVWSEVGGASTRPRLRVGVVGQGSISRAHTHGAFMQLRQLEVAAEVQPVVLCGHILAGQSSCRPLGL